jgi:hypothetical protein
MLLRIMVVIASAVAPVFEQGMRIIPFVRPWSTMERKNQGLTGSKSVINLWKGEQKGE